MLSIPHRLIRRTVLRLANKRRKLTLLSLPNDTLVDLILDHLCVRDIVCRRLYELTHQPMVWKRILRTLHLPLPPLPPTVPYSFHALSSLEAERLVIRALAAEANWRSTIPQAYKTRMFCVFADVMSIKIVPGGKYVVASIREGANRYALMLLMMEHRVKTAYPVAKISICSKAYKLDAKYMCYETEMGIMISYVRREPKRSSDRKAGVDVSDYSEDHVIDFPVPVRYELNVIHCPLSSLHVAEDPRFPPGSSAYTARIDTRLPPFHRVTVIRSNTTFDFTDIDVLDGTPYVIAVQARLILFKNLVSRNVHRIRVVGAPFGSEEEVPDLPDELLTYDIRAVRIIAPQRELLVVRTDRKDATMPLALELYKIPHDSEPSQVPDAPQVAYPRSVRTIPTASTVLHVAISAVPSFTDGEDAAAALTAHAEPPPISIFVVMRDPWFTKQFRMWPERIPKTEIGQFRPDSERQQAEIQAAAAAAEGVAEEDGQVAEALEVGSEDALAVDHPAMPPASLRDTTFHFQLYGPFFKVISYKYNADPTLGNLRILPGTTRPLFFASQAGDRRATPALHDLWAYADFVAPPAADACRPEDVERRAAGEAERGWLDAAVKSRGPTAVVQLALLPREIREKFSRGLVAVEWDDWSMSMCGVCVDEPSMIYLFQFAPTPTEKQDGHRFPIPVPDVDGRFREVSEKDPYGMFEIIPEIAGR
ncbi:hypothetical protein BC826DRAFT_966413 [Russula brevipes]|nr:hypothetical protein BC826DRAFT_966413 [Russula brevipes]